MIQDRLREALYQSDGPDVAVQVSCYPLAIAALLLAEWSGYHLKMTKTCPRCGGRWYRDEWEGPRHGQEPKCIIDAALYSAGFHDQASRDAARRRLSA